MFLSLLFEFGLGFGCCPSWALLYSKQGPETFFPECLEVFFLLDSGESEAKQAIDFLSVISDWVEIMRCMQQSSISVPCLTLSGRQFKWPLRCTLKYSVITRVL
ncbi:hypothetical protein FVEG_16759 [Fusarium verticillioides 7600]|uniref:Uncharacterized protein n=1 Tax=Gibberella moniliformis (strain M3125 / FGSC 7600) TaxID=334819 RepID=W7MHE2_GIBM7|nr:hypothetical protein FVEG_16759 [Fusarium verticillioides 7600]EWG51148.1 hypothetical protein FVEG_16759 [Fusarium verticillioides 7600]